MDLTEGVSIVIVTYNGTGRLENTLKHLAKQDLPDTPLELLVIDNNSSDGTYEFCESFWKKNNTKYPIRIVVEKQQGTMYARKRGIDEAKYRYILFCDDDNWLNQNYVSTAYNLIKASDKIAVVGGYGIPQYEDGFTPPEWMKLYEKNMGTGMQGNVEGDTTLKKGSLYTAGAILDRVWLNRLYAYGFKSFLKGRDGKSLVAGEDTELTYALRLIGGQLHFSKTLTFKHELPAGRVNWEYIKKLWFSFGVSDFVILPYVNHFKRIVYNKAQYKANVLSELKSLQEEVSRLDNLEEGDMRLVKIERLKGVVFAMDNYADNFIGCKKVVTKLAWNSSSSQMKIKVAIKKMVSTLTGKHIGMNKENSIKS